MKREEPELRLFEQFLKEFEQKSNTDRQKKLSLIKRRNFSYTIKEGVESPTLNIWKDKSRIASLSLNRCWIQDSEVSNLLYNFFPNLIGFFRNREKLCQSMLVR